MIMTVGTVFLKSNVVGVYITDRQAKCTGFRNDQILIIDMDTNQLQRKWFEMEKLEELMVITMEECGELIQECSKSIRMQEYNRDELKEELSDVMCMLELMIENKIITRTELNNGANLKKMKLMKWSNLL
tara:strand:- start:2297 stop:2686 length:390 start_codon:yes stop_codon:yes gene_type:complete